MHLSPSTAVLGNIGGMELVVIFLIVLIVFGAKRMPEFARSLAKALREVQKAGRELRNALVSADREPPTHDYREIYGRFADEEEEKPGGEEKKEGDEEESPAG